MLPSHVEHVCISCSVPVGVSGSPLPGLGFTGLFVRPSLSPPQAENVTIMTHAESAKNKNEKRDCLFIRLIFYVSPLLLVSTIMKSLRHHFMSLVNIFANIG